jgi:DNA polymerase bacteriophage-type
MLHVVEHHARTRDVVAGTAHVLHRDYETRSQVPLRSVGVHRYAADPSTEILCCAHAIDDEPAKLWTPGDGVPPEFIEAASDPNWVVAAHNDAFETAIEQHVLHPRYGFPLIPLERHRCTMAMALAAGLPARLSAAADALELSSRKDAAGERLMHQTSKPRRAHKDEDPSKVYWFDDSERFTRLYSYCQQDVEVERELHARLAPLSPATGLATRTGLFSPNTRPQSDRAAARARTPVERAPRAGASARRCSSSGEEG